MNNAWKGALLSGLLIPGLGQVVLKRYKRGVTIMLVFLASLSVVAAKALQQALAILEKIESKGGAIGMGTISDAASEASTASGDVVFNLFLLLAVLCWIAGIIDAYRIGMQMDIDKRSPPRPSNAADN